MLSGRSFIKVRNRIGPTYLSTHTLPDLNYLNSRVPGSMPTFGMITIELIFLDPVRTILYNVLFCSYSHSVKRFYLSPPIKIFYCSFQGGASFVDHLCYFCLVFVMHFVHLCLLMPCGHCWDLLALVCDV